MQLRAYEKAARPAALIGQTHEDMAHPWRPTLASFVDRSELDPRAFEVPFVDLIWRTHSGAECTEWPIFVVVDPPGFNRLPAGSIVPNARRSRTPTDRAPAT